MSEAYRQAGVDLDAGLQAVALIRDIASNAQREEVRGGVGGFAGLFDLGGGRYLAAGTDGVGTKIEIARMLDKLDTIGIDLVAMCADDVVCTGAEPLFFLDYLAVGQVDPERVASIVSGVAEGCRQAGAALLGGETAEHPGTMEPDAFDLAGFCVGLVEEKHMIGPSRIAPGDTLIGLASSGLHSNGYSLVRHALVDSGTHALDAIPDGFTRTLGEELLEPTRIYAHTVIRLARAARISAAAHITGGGLPENVPRILPEGAGVRLDTSAWKRDAIFGLVQSASGASDDDMYATFNMGIGMVLAVAPPDVDEVLVIAGESCPAMVIGSVTDTPGFELA